MSKNRDPASHFAKSKGTFLPGKGQGSDDPDTDALLGAMATILGALYAMAMCVVVPLWALVRYMTYEAWARERPKRKNR